MILVHYEKVYFRVKQLIKLLYGTANEFLFTFVTVIYQVDWGHLFISPDGDLREIINSALGMPIHRWVIKNRGHFISHLHQTQE